MNFNQYVQCNTGAMIITGLSELTNGVKLSKDYTGWDFRVWVLAVVTGWPGCIKPQPNNRNMPTHVATLLGATCCVRLATVLRCVAKC